MSLSDKQFNFAKDVVLLLSFAINKGWKFTLGEVQRPEEMQEIYFQQNKSQTMQSLHLEKLAIDINFFKPKNDAIGFITRYQYTTEKEDLQMFGDFWESLSNKNEWGGNWENFLDTPHFQRNK